MADPVLVINAAFTDQHAHQPLRTTSTAVVFRRTLIAPPAALLQAPLQSLLQPPQPLLLRRPLLIMPLLHMPLLQCMALQLPHLQGMTVDKTRRALCLSSMHFTPGLMRMIATLLEV